MQKIKAIYITNFGLFNIPNHIIKAFEVELFFEPRAEIFKKKFVAFLVETMTPKSLFEINLPLESQFPFNAE